MSLLARLESSFKPEIRKSGEDLAAGGRVTLSSASDTAVRAFGGGLNAVRVTLRSESVGANGITATCTCTPAKKGALCKHEWAALVLAAAKHPDFLNAKTDVRAGAAPAAESSGPSPVVREKQAELKERQAAYRKERYRAQKARAKELKGGKPQGPSKSAPVPSGEAAAALGYFERNGFPMAFPADGDALNNARKILARVFHPDKGGTHDEIVELNLHYDVLAAKVR